MATNSSSFNNGQNDIKELVDVVVVMVPFPAQGHLNPLLHISHLLSSYNLSIYYLSFRDKIDQVKLRVQGWDPLTIHNIHFQEFQTPPSNEIPQRFSNKSSEGNKSQKILLPAINESLMLREPVGAFLLEVARKTRRVVVIYDSLMAYVVQDIASIPNAEAYCYNGASAFTISSIYWDVALRKLHLPSFIGSVVGKLLIFPSGFGFPSNLPSHQSSFIHEFQDFIRMQNSYGNTFCSGNLYSTCKAVEGPYLDVLAKFNRLLRQGRQWAFGPLHPINILERKCSENRHECLKWLDKQEPNSVMLVSFGTTVSLSAEQIKELAIGLEKSQQKFIWVVRDALLQEGEQVKIQKNYEKRVKGRGMVVKDWAPQLEILEHSSTGGFMSHCGWNSCMESISMGVPIATWPMFLDHPRNAVLITEVLKIGVVVKDWEHRDELITRTTIEASVKKLMDSPDGNEMRKRAGELGKRIRQSVTTDGDSKREMDLFIAHITRK